jgi:hypothetical protein
MNPMMEGAILNELYNLSAPVRFECQTGNCQWDVFSTLAVTSNCTNVTSSTRVLCDKIPNGDLCNYTTPSRFFIEGMVAMLNGLISDIYFNSSVTYQPDSQFGEAKPNSTIMSFAAAKMLSPFSLFHPEVMECDMRWTSRLTHNVTVINGTFYPGVSQDIELLYMDNPFDTDQWVVFNVTGDYTAFPDNRSFSINLLDYIQTASFLYDVFSPQFNAIALANSTSLTETLGMMGSSMTYVLGQAQSAEKVPGQSISTEQYIFVSWPWIVLPIMEVLMSIALLICTLIHTRRKAVIAWKSSAIAPMLTSMDGWNTEDLRTTSARDLKKRSETMRGLLLLDEHNVQSFTRVDMVPKHQARELQPRTSSSS